MIFKIVRIGHVEFVYNSVEQGTSSTRKLLDIFLYDIVYRDTWDIMLTESDITQFADKMLALCDAYDLRYFWQLMDYAEQNDKDLQAKLDGSLGVYVHAQLALRGWDEDTMPEEIEDELSANNVTQDGGVVYRMLHRDPTYMTWLYDGSDNV